MNQDFIEHSDLEYINNKARYEFEKISGSKLLLIGSGGFLGYYFVKSIINWNDNNADKKIHLTALSSFRNGVPKWLKNLEGRKDFKLLKKDITKYKIPLKENYDYIIHAASIASPTYYRLHPIETINANVKGLYNILDFLVDKKKSKKSVKGLLFFSTSEIYGDPTRENIPTPETYRGNVSCTGPRACYDESKRFCETLCVNFANVYKLPIKIARPFNNYGPGLKIDDKRVIPDIAKDILKNKNVVLYSNGKPSRTFCYVADAIVGYFKILVKGKSGEAYNIGTEKPEIDILSLANKMTKIARKEFGYKGGVKFAKNADKEYLTDNPQRRCPVIRKAKKDLGYNPQISLDDGLLRIMKWYKTTI